MDQKFGTFCRSKRVRFRPDQHRRQPLGKASGFTLIELLIGLVISLILIAAASQLFLGSRLTFQASEALARTQESGRFAVATMAPAMRSTGLGGVCGGTARFRNHLDLTSADADSLLSPFNPVRGWEYSGTGVGATVSLDNLAPGVDAGDLSAGGNVGDLPAAITTLALPFSDVLLVRENRPIANLTGDAGNLQNQPVLTVAGAGLNQIGLCDTILVTNCNSADLFQVAALSGTGLSRATTGSCNPGNGPSAQLWSTGYGTAAQFHRVQQRAFFIGQRAGREPALFSATFGNGLAGPVIEELVDGIENMQVIYGYSFPGNTTPRGDGQSVDLWLAADDVPNWEYVVAVRVGLLARSPMGLGGAAAQQNFDLARTTVTHPPDRLLRQPHNVTFTLRNRQIVR